MLASHIVFYNTFESQMSDVQCTCTKCRWGLLLVLCVIVGVPTFVLKFTPAPLLETKNSTVQEWSVTRGLSVVDLLLCFFSTIIQVRTTTLLCHVTNIIIYTYV